MIKIIADENIPFANEAFGKFGEVITIAGREINKNYICKADILLIRSITKINSNLLDGTSIKFVGTATSGTDHIDKKYLYNNNVVLSSAPGCNAKSVAEYVITAICNHIFRNNFKNITCGIIGVGNIGNEVNKL